jgi:hypothetical protein
VPDSGESDPDRVSACAAVAVFVERARAVAPGFEVTAQNAPQLAALCRRLAGIPLALELAAARIRFLSPQALLSRLDDAMVRAGGPDLPARQRTLRATFDWSYDLLAPAEQRLLRLLSVFHGGGTLDAVEDVSAATGETEPVLALLEVLVEHSLVVVSSDPDGETRFGLLEPVAQYARSRQDARERIAVSAAHAACFLGFAERAAPEYLAADQVAWLDRSEREDANLNAASPGPWSRATATPPAGCAGRSGSSGGCAGGCWRAAGRRGGARAGPVTGRAPVHGEHGGRHRLRPRRLRGGRRAVAARPRRWPSAARTSTARPGRSPGSASWRSPVVTWTPPRAASGAPSRTPRGRAATGTGSGPWCTSGSAPCTWCAGTCRAPCSRCARASSPHAVAVTG